MVKYNAHDGASDGYSFQVADTIVNRDEVFECVIIDEVWYQLFLADSIGWDYIETTLGGQTIRGFIPGGSLFIYTTDDADIEEIDING